MTMARLHDPLQNLMCMVPGATLIEGLKGNQTGGYLCGLFETAAEGAHVENDDVMGCDGKCVGNGAVFPEARRKRILNAPLNMHFLTQANQL